MQDKGKIINLNQYKTRIGSILKKDSEKLKNPLYQTKINKSLTAIQKELQVITGLIEKNIDKK